MRSCIWWCIRSCIWWCMTTQIRSESFLFQMIENQLQLQYYKWLNDSSHPASSSKQRNHISCEIDSDLTWLLQNILQMIIINLLCSLFVCIVPSVGPVVDVQQITGSSVDLSWKPIPVEQTHGFIQGYTLSYSSANQSVRREWCKHVNLPRRCRPHVWIQTYVTWKTGLGRSPVIMTLAFVVFREMCQQRWDGLSSWH